MGSLKLLKSSLFLIVLLTCSNLCIAVEGDKSGNFMIGWASVDITPDEPVLISGQSHARVSEGVMDPLAVTALAMESGSGSASERVVMVSCDISSFRDGLLAGTLFNLRERVRDIMLESFPELEPEKLFINATHTHSGPYFDGTEDSKGFYGIELDVMPLYQYQEFLAESIVSAARQAWEGRKPGGISYGLGHAVAGHNRLQVDLSGQARMYGSVNRPEFSHIEGFEDHSVNLLYTWDNRRNLTGVVVNVASPSQVSESKWELSADYWHDVRVELRGRLGDDLHILPQCSAGGDQSPHVMVETRAEERMQRLMFPDVESGRGSLGRRKQIAVRIADAVTSVLPYVSDEINWDPVFGHRREELELTRRLLTADDVNQAVAEGESYREQYERLIKEIEENPSIKEKPRWYMDVTRSYRLSMRGRTAMERFELQEVEPKMTTEVHVVRIGDIVMATNQFELYLDYGIRIKGRSPAVQTFIVQLAGWGGSYLPPARSIEGGGYGSFPSNNRVGPEGGQDFVENTLRIINSLWEY